MLGRAWLHHQLVAERNHARQERISADVAAAQSLMDSVPDDLRRAFAGLFKEIRGGSADGATRTRLAAGIERLLARTP
jgi:hypothetical protein